MPRRRLAAALGAATLAVLAGCGVEPIEPAERTATTTTTPAPTDSTPTTPAPTGDDLVDFLLRAGYSDDEATCGAEGLRAALDDDEIAEIVSADDLNDIDGDVIDEFNEALTSCLED